MLGSPPAAKSGPLAIIANHPSWWDGEVFIWLSAAILGRRCFSPMDAAMLARYPFFGRIGAFGVETGTLAGAATFLAVSERVLAEPDGILLVNAEARFNDVRTRPLAVLPGIAHLAKRLPAITFVPLAIEYVFWDERRPNLLLRFGRPVAARDYAEGGTADVIAGLNEALATTMDELSAAAATRDPRRFQTVLAGRVGINPFYDLWRRARAAARGQRFSPAHSDR